MANDFPTEFTAEKFLTSVHSVFLDGKYRNSNLNSKIFGRYEQFHTFPNEFVSTAVKSLSALVEEKQIEFLDTKHQPEIQKEALIYFLIFELIHPFIDGNGRSGRALFAFLQRKLSKNRILKPLHIPVGHMNVGAGSIESEIHGIMQLKVFQTSDIIKIMEEIKSLREMDNVEEFIPSAIRDLYNSLSKDENVDKLLEMVEEKSKLDSLSERNWVETTNLIKQVL